MKRCNKCGGMFHESEFYTRKSGQYEGYIIPCCKFCFRKSSRERHKIYYENKAYRAIISAKNQKYRDKHPAYGQEWRKKNPDYMPNYNKCHKKGA